jgi:diguanylate cyclase (GGDEF)-like protein
MSRSLNFFSTHEAQRLTRPISFAMLFFATAIMIFGIQEASSQGSISLFLFGLIFGIFAGIQHELLGKLYKFSWGKWPTMGSGILVLWIGIFILPEEWQHVVHVGAAFLALTLVILWGRNLAWSFLGVILLSDLLNHAPSSYLTRIFFIEHLSLLIFSFGITETFYRLAALAGERVQRLTTLNDFSHRVAMSLEAEQVMSLLNAAIQNALDADTYFVGLSDGEKLHLDLIYDDGEYFAPVTVPLEGSLSGWILRNRRSLFIPDLREEMKLEGVKVVLTGNNKDNLSWMGVPMLARHINGVIAIGSYRPEAFNRADFELLENLGQQAALALDNAHHHTEVERQSMLDSLTGTYNHGNFIRLVEQETQKARAMNETVSLIMLDIDYFKQYNDTYGHLTGDLVLVKLVETIRKYIHTTDISGRWGGEEFVICLPNTNGSQANMVAQRIRQTMMELRLTHPEKGDIPAPTVSQGIASFPQEAEDVFQLVDVADQRLYIAKERGRNQIEPAVEHWDKILG